MDNDDWQAAIAAYLTHYWHMGAVGVLVALQAWEADEAMRARYLRMAGGTQ